MTKKNRMTYDLLIRRTWFFVGVLILCTGCHMLERRPDDTLLAEAYNNRLYLEDIEAIISPGTSPGDSAAIIDRYVDQWVEQQVFLHHARSGLPSEKKDFERQVTDYENSLLRHAFESELALKEMDTMVMEQEIENFYEKNKAQFTLRNNIVKATYIKLPLSASDISIARSLYRSEDQNDLVELENYCLENAATYLISPDNWMLFYDILTDMPLDLDDPASYLRDNTYAEITDNYYRYFLSIHEYRLKGDISPISFEKDNIRTLILSRRKKDFIQSKRRDFMNEAVEANRVETYF